MPEGEIDILGELKSLAASLRAAIRFEADNHAHGVLPLGADIADTGAQKKEAITMASPPQAPAAPKQRKDRHETPGSPGLFDGGAKASGQAGGPIAEPEPAAAEPPVLKKDRDGNARLLDALRSEIGEDCSRCRLCSLGRSRLVFGVGNPAADLVFVGEGPGEDEDIMGEPFVGKAGQLLTKMIAAMGLRREDVYICNVVKCRPPDNRNPEWDEMQSCGPFLKKQLEIIRPRVVVALGRTAASYLLGIQDLSIGKVRGKLTKFEGSKLMLTYHPAFLLRSPNYKAVVWEDLQIVMKELGLNPSQKKGK